MAHEKIAAGHEMVAHMRQHRLLRLPTEIDYDIPTKNDVLPLGNVIGLAHQIQPLISPLPFPMHVQSPAPPGWQEGQ